MFAFQLPMFQLPLFAQVAKSLNETMDLSTKSLIVFGVIGVSIALGVMLSRAFRMPGHGWRIGLTAFALLAGAAICVMGWPPKLGIDLSGGVILVYEVDQEKKEAGKTVDMDKLIGSVAKRINPSGAKEIAIRKYGEEQIEIVVPEIDQDEIRRIKDRITKIGALEFRIVCNKFDHADLIARALALPPNERDLKAADGSVTARFVDIVNKPDVIAEFFQNTKYGTRPGPFKDDAPQILVKMDPFNVTGADMTSARSGENLGSPCVNFNFGPSGAARFGGLTGANLPDKATQRERQLAILLDNNLESAPNIQSQINESGQITGRFSEKEVNDLVSVLNAGSLPTALRKEPSTELSTGPTLGADTIRQAQIATVASMCVVVLFMVVYYRAAGVIASFALLINLLLTVAAMILIKAPFTLTGVAGLALTLGMAVDANVLIYERMREEFARGATLRMAIVNGFSKASTTIIDSNLTTLITSVVLYWLGTDQIKGFAVTLTIGLLISLFTAIFCSRVVLDIVEKRKWLTKLNMMQFVGETHFDFMGKWRACAAISVAIIGIGIVAMAVRGANMLDIDFTGGTSIQVLFKEPIPIADVRAKLTDVPADAKQAAEAQIAESQSEDLQRQAREALGKDAAKQALDDWAKKRATELADLKDVAVSAVRLPGEAEGRRYIFNTSNPSIKAVETIVKDLFKGQLDHNSMTVEGIAQITESKAAPAATTTPPADGAAKPAEKSGASNAGPGDEQIAALDSQEPACQEPEAKPAEQPKETPAPPAQEKPAAEAKPAESKPVDQPVAGPAAAPAAKPDDKPAAAATPSTTIPAATTPAAVDPFVGGTTATLKFREAVNREAVESWLKSSLAAVEDAGDFQLTAVGVTDATGSKAFPEWTVRTTLKQDRAETVFKAVAARLDETPVFPASSNIGGKVAGSTRLQAVYALLASLVLIVVYIWFRFDKVVFGLAAVVALLHDVLICLAAIAVTPYLAPVLGFMQINPMKIDLTIMAALLTVVGYSINDTIVVFDRIREVRGKSPNVTVDMLNLSINQTLSRTILTGMTTLFVLVILYFWGGQGIHGFAYTLLVGIIVGTFSSIYVASPILLWLMKPGELHKAKAASLAKPSNEPAGSRLARRA